MNVIVSNASDKPIYEQIYSQIKGAILRGEVKEGELLPSIRAKRAFDDLERDGFICTVQGKGSFVAEKNGELIREEHLKQAEEKFSEGVELARLGGASSEEIEEMFRLILKGE